MKGSMRLTKQGVRDLGGNRRVRDQPAPRHRTFAVDVGADAHSGMTLRIVTASPRAAYDRAVTLIRDAAVHAWHVVRRRRPDWLRCRAVQSRGDHRCDVRSRVELPACSTRS